MILLAALLAAAPTSSWREVVSPHFVLRTDLPQPKARELSQFMEFARSGLVEAILDGRDLQRRRIEVIAFAEQKDFEPFAPFAEAAGMLSSRDGVERILLGPLEDVRGLRYVSHEIAHQLLYQRFPLQPHWFSEGMAEYFSLGSTTKSGRYVYGLPFPWKLREAGEHKISLRELFAWKGPGGYEHYVWSWLLVHFLVNRHPRELSELESKLENYQEPKAEPWDPDQLDVEIERYRKHPGRSLWVPAKSSAISSERELSAAEAIMTRLKLQPRWSAQEIEAQLQLAISLDPNNVEALEMKSPKNAAAAERAVAAHPEDPGAWLFFGHALERDAPERSEACYRKALELSPNDPDIALDFATFLDDRKRPREALPLILQAQREEPWRQFAFFNGAFAHAHAGECNLAERDAIRLSRLAAATSSDTAVDFDTRELIASALRRCRDRNVDPNHLTCP